MQQLILTHLSFPHPVSWAYFLLDWVPTGFKSASCHIGFHTLEPPPILHHLPLLKIAFLKECPDNPPHNLTIQKLSHAIPEVGVILEGFLHFLKF